MTKKFNQQEYQNEWNKNNLLPINGKYKKEFVLEFREACQKLNIPQSEIFKKAMQETIEKAKKPNSN